MPEGDPLLGTPDADQFICQMWHELGLASKTGMGETVISWTEIDSYSRIKHLDIEPWEADCLVMMSREYLNFKHQASESRHVLSPYQPVITKDDLIKRVSHFEKTTEQK